MDNQKIIDEVMGGSLRVLNRIADSPLVERLGLEARAQQLVYEGAKRAAETAAKAAQRRSSKRAADGSRESRKFDLSLSERAQGRALRAAPLRALMMVALDAMAGRRLQATPNTMLFNLTGQPGISLPLHWTAGDLPVGMQFVARYGDEGTVLRLAGQIERAHPWTERRPPGVP